MLNTHGIGAGVRLEARACRLGARGLSRTAVIAPSRATTALGRTRPFEAGPAPRGAGGPTRRGLAGYRPFALGASGAADASSGGRAGQNPEATAGPAPSIRSLAGALSVGVARPAMEAAPARAICRAARRTVFCQTAGARTGRAGRVAQP